MKEMKFPPSLLVDWGNMVPPSGISLVLSLFGVRDSGGSMLALRKPTRSRSLSMSIVSSVERVNSEARLIDLAGFGIAGGDDQPSDRELEIILAGADSLEMRRTPDDDIRAELSFKDGNATERFFFLRGAAIMNFSVADAMFK